MGDVARSARVLAKPAHLRKTIGVALVVGTILFAINQLNLVLAHPDDPVIYVKGVLAYLVPFCVANYGILVATRRDRLASR